MGPREMRMGSGEGSTMRNFILHTVQSRRLRWAGHVTRMEEGRSSFNILTDKSTGNGSLGRSRRKWEDNIRMDPKEIVRGIELIQPRSGIIGEPL